MNKKRFYSDDGKYEGEFKDGLFDGKGIFEIVADLKKFQEKIDVQTRTWSYIIDKYEIRNYKNVVIQTDCEGHDLILLKNFPFEKVKPKMYFAEIYGKTRYPESHPRYGEEIGLYSQKDENEAKEIFLKNSYIIHQFGDILAVLKE